MEEGVQGGGTRVLMVDDDVRLCRLTERFLAPMGYEVFSVHTGPEGLDAVLTGQWHVVLLDVMLPGLDGFELLRRIRARSDVPVLMRSARGESDDRIVGLELGADDYLPKTFTPRELLARIRAVTRRRAGETVSSGAVVPDEVAAGALRIHTGLRRAWFQERELELTATEFDLLLAFTRSRGRVRTRESLVEEIRDRSFEAFDRSIDVHVSSLRRKLGDDARNPRWIRTLRSLGYQLVRTPGEPR
jgi:DNA-binding response OmpR family regulator